MGKPTLQSMSICWVFYWVSCFRFSPKQLSQVIQIIRLSLLARNTASAIAVTTISIESHRPHCLLGGGCWLWFSSSRQCCSLRRQDRYSSLRLSNSECSSLHWGENTTNVITTSSFWDRAQVRARALCELPLHSFGIFTTILPSQPFSGVSVCLLTVLPSLSGMCSFKWLIIMHIIILHIIHVSGLTWLWMCKSFVNGGTKTWSSSSTKDLRVILIQASSPGYSWVACEYWGYVWFRVCRWKEFCYLKDTIYIKF